MDSIANRCIYPNLIIGGVFKAGTTSLFSYLSQHKDIGFSSKKELGYFIPVMFDMPLEPIDSYLKYFKHLEYGHKYVLEASPGYLYGGERVARKMKSVLGDYNIIFILREPRDRLISFYEYLKTSYVFAYEDRLNKQHKIFIKKMNFSQYLDRSFLYFNNTVSKEDEYLLSGVKYSLYSECLESWYAAIGKKNIKIIFFDDLKNNPIGVMEDVCEWLGITADIFDDYTFAVQNRTMQVRNKSIHKIAVSLNRKMEPILRRNMRLKNSLRTTYSYFNQALKNNMNYEVNEEVNRCFECDVSNLKILLNKQGVHNFPKWLS